MSDNGAAPKNLVKKLAEVMAAVGKIPKKGHNDHFNYDFVREAEVSEALSRELSSRNLIMVPDVESMDFRGDGKYCVLMVRWTIMDGDSGETLPFRIPGMGQDSGDKGPYKALTGSQKYAGMKLLQISTGDDPENDHGAQNGRQQPEARRGRPQGPKIGVPIEQVGNPDRKSVPTTDAEVAQAFPPGIETDEPRDPRPDFLAGKLECPNCGRRVYKRKDGSAWFCWQQKGGCGGQWRAEPIIAAVAAVHAAVVDKETGEVTKPPDPMAVAAERGALVTRARKLAELVGLTADEMKTTWRTYCGDTTKDTAKPADVRLYIAWLETRWEAKQKSA